MPNENRSIYDIFLSVSLGVVAICFVVFALETLLDILNIDAGFSKLWGLLVFQLVFAFGSAFLSVVLLRKN